MGPRADDTEESSLPRMPKQHNAPRRNPESTARRGASPWSADDKDLVFGAHAPSLSVYGPRKSEPSARVSTARPTQKKGMK